MLTAICELIVYPKNEKLDYRQLSFKKGCVNVITGTNQRGKSAIGKIIDYCLASTKCTIPVGIIRDSVSWYAILIQIEEKYHYIARKVPGGGAASTEFCYHELELPEVISSPEKTHSIDQIKNIINNLFGLPNVPLAPQEEGQRIGYNARASFRDLAAFNHLPQHIVANPNALFYRIETAPYRERLKRIFPLALGVVDGNYLELIHSQAELKKKLDAKQKEFDSKKEASNTWLHELTSFYLKAQELGLLPPNIPCPDESEKIICSLKELLEPEVNTQEIEGRTVEAVSRLNKLLGQIEKSASELEAKRRRLAHLKRLSLTFESHTKELNHQKGRVESVGWFYQYINSSNKCPLCGQEDDIMELEYLKKLAISLKQQSDKIKDNPTILQKEIHGLQKEINQLEKEIDQRRKEKFELERVSVEARQARQSFQARERFVGRVDQAIHSIGEIDDSGPLAGEVEGLATQFKAITKDIQKYKVVEKQRTALEQIGRTIQNIAKTLGLEKSDAVVRLVVDEFTLEFDDTRSKDYLWEIGSGENWMGYHIATLLALHKYFIDLTNNPVPSFLIVDQPTQVYFPTVNDSYDRLTKSGADESSTSIDVSKAKAIFVALAQMVTEAKGKLQIIVTEHADDMTYGGVEFVNEVDNWRGDDKALIPQAWISQTAQQDGDQA